VSQGDGKLNSAFPAPLSVCVSQGDGKLYYGLHIENGRIKGESQEALREVIEGFNLPVRISANQNLILCDIRKSWKPRVTQALAAAGLVVRPLPLGCNSNKEKRKRFLSRVGW